MDQGPALSTGAGIVLALKKETYFTVAPSHCCINLSSGTCNLGGINQPSAGKDGRKEKRMSGSKVDGLSYMSAPLEDLKEQIRRIDCHGEIYLHGSWKLKMI